MIFQKSAPKNYSPELPVGEEEKNEQPSTHDDNVETVVGPSVNVEGDFASEGNIIVKGSVAGSVHTSKYLVVEPGARILANVRAGSAQVSGEVKGNMKIKESLELTATARVLGDIEAKTLIIEAGALLLGKVVMPGLEEQKPRSGRATSRRVVTEEIANTEEMV